MAIDLSSITSGKNIKPPKIIIYGVDGIGKSTFATSPKDAIVIPTENRLGHIDCTSFPMCRTWDEVMECVESLATEDHNFKYVVMDSLDWLERLAHKELCKRHKEKVISSNDKGSDFSFGRGYVLAQDLMSEFRDAVDYLHDEKGMGVILTVHADIKKFENPLGASYDHFVPNVHERVREMFQHWADCIFFANYPALTREEDGGFNKKKTKATGNGNRIMYTEERPAFKAKNSYNLPSEMALSWEDFEQAFESFKNNDKKEIKKNGKEK